MSHMTNKKRLLRDKNARSRVRVLFNTGTISHGNLSNAGRKAALAESIARKEWGE